ncbi:MAG: gfo/Idh/MocA family oxidoreductase, partial [Ilumatobacter sp.]
LKGRIQAGAIGEVVSVDANFCLRLLDLEGRHRRRDLGGGRLLEIGIYPLSLGRFLLGEPVEIKALGRLTTDGVDAVLGGVMTHESGGITTFRSGLEALSDLTASIVGTSGRATVEVPFWAPEAFTLERSDGSELERVHLPHRGLAHEAEHAMARIRAGENESDVQTWAATVANMELMDEVRRQLGVTYDVD